MTTTDTIERRTTNPEEILEDIGGCGRYQVRMTAIVHLIKTVFCFSTSNLLISTVTPTWWCAADKSQTNVSTHIKTNNLSTDTSTLMSCITKNETKCALILYDDSISTLVSEVRTISSFVDS